MTEKRLILHIGRQKTGTTAIQSHLAFWRSELEEQGFWYPESPGGQIAHHDLAIAVEAGEIETSRWSEVLGGRGGAPECETTILSSEAFQRVPPTNVAAVLDGVSPQVVVYLREHYRGAQSSYCQAVHARTVTFSFDVFLRRQKRTLASFLEDWTSTFGTEAVVARTYPPASGDIRTDFAEVAGLPILEPQASTLSNPSIGGDLLRFKLVLNRLGVPEAELRKVSYGPIGRIASTNADWRVPPEASEEARASFLDLAQRDRTLLETNFAIRLGEIPEQVERSKSALEISTVAKDVCEALKTDSPHAFGELQELVDNVAKSIESTDAEAQALAEVILSSI